jgi:hypothetical protein
MLIGYEVIEKDEPVLFQSWAGFFVREKQPIKRLSQVLSWVV